ncbi:MAG: hydrogenase maturation protease [Methylococcales bacterium]|nr:hydrogenase maturation protease [Methylococcales bacterium]
MVKPVLVFGYGNLSRGDDALGPLLLDYIESHCALEAIEILCDFQLQIEHALDLENRCLVLFVDASVSCEDAFSFTQIEPAKDKSYTTHTMSPAAVLDVYQSIKKQPPPLSFLLSIKAEKLELGEGLSTPAKKHLEQACQFADQLLQNPELKDWLQEAKRSEMLTLASCYKIGNQVVTPLP